VLIVLQTAVLNVKMNKTINNFQTLETGEYEH
jgi:hypothetical protein